MPLDGVLCFMTLELNFFKYEMMAYEVTNSEDSYEFQNGEAAKLE
jgi:hypothetical protein